MLTPKTDWKPPQLSELPSWAGAKRVAVDIETKDLDLRKLGPGVRRPDCYIVGVAFAIDDGPCAYLPVAHAEQWDHANLDRDAVFQYLRDQAKVFKGEIVGANLQYDMDYLAHVGIHFDGIYRDVQVAEPILDELQMSYSLENIAHRHGLKGKDESFLKRFAHSRAVDPKAGIWALPPEAVGAYAEQDVRLPLELLRRQEEMIDRQGLRPVFDLECRLQKVLLKMRRRGVAVDLNQVDYIQEMSRKREKEVLDEIHKQTGVRMVIHGEKSDINLKKPLLEVMRFLGLDVPTTDKGNPSITNEFLNSIQHPVGDLIRNAKKWNKLRGTFCKSIRTHQVNGRIHCTFNQLRGEKAGGDGESGARYGRLSCVNPNLQQQPSRDPEIGSLWRSIYIPDEGGQWACLDYSQQEPRWLVHYAETLRQLNAKKLKAAKNNLAITGDQYEVARLTEVVHSLRKSKAAVTAYCTDPTTDNHQMMADLCGTSRKEAKTVFLGMCYGMGGGKLCRSLGLPTEVKVHSRLGIEYEAAGAEGQAIIEKFNQGVPFVRGLQKLCEAAAAERGYIRTAGGRRCRFPRRSGGGYEWAHKALNRLIQGSSGDQTKAAMVVADEAGCRLQLQVHDELDLTIWDRKEAEHLAEIMRGALPCMVPAKVDIEIGPNWGSIE
jgi:DNA polymerase I-like protein with 3'-5' exonuclease and polymerase domains